MVQHAWDKEALLKGPKKPYWSCACGGDGNWHNRTSCRVCGREAPTTIKNDQRANHKKALAAEKKQQPRSGPARRPAGAWEKGPPVPLAPVDLVRRQLATAKRDKYPQPIIDAWEKELAEELGKVQAARPLARQTRSA